MQTVDVVIDSSLRVPIKAIGRELARELVSNVKLVNPERAQAEEMMRHGFEKIPKFFDQGSFDGDYIVLPRGYAAELKKVLTEEDMRIRWVDRRRYRKGSPLGKEEFSYREHQPAAVKAIRKHQQLIYKAPTGSGKTVTVCGAMWELSPDRSLILVDRINLVDQWIDRIAEHVGVNKDDIGRIGDGHWSEGRITVATIQTLHKQRKRLVKEGWFKSWSFVCLDEMHHVTANTFRDLFGEFTARYRFGVSATPDKTGVFDLALDTIGDVAYETTIEELRALGILVEPTVEVIPTEFKFKYHSDHKANKRGECEIWGCPNEGIPYHRHKNNYHKLKQALVADKERNQLIVSKLLDGRNISHVQLVITDQTSQIHELEATLALADVPEGSSMPTVYILTGKQTAKQRAKIIAAIEDSGEPCIILSTIAGEALDIPIIDRVHLPWPTANPRKTEQNVGRGTRSHISKLSVVIYDYADMFVGVLGNQFGKRRKECYIPLGFKVVVPEDFGMNNKGGGLGRVGSL